MHKHSVRLVAAILVVSAVTFIVFSPVLQHDFLRYDDEVYVYENPYIKSLKLENIAWMFTNSYFRSYTPLALLSHSIDYALFGFDPRGHHLTNLLLHSANAIWVLLLALAVFSAVKGREAGTPPLSDLVARTDFTALAGAVFAALAFALHPLKVESVAWISDRKDLLLGFFILPSMLCYLQYAALRGQHAARKWLNAALLLFLLALLSKTIAIMLPAVLIAADMLLLDSFAGWRKKMWPLMKEKIPFFALSGLFMIFSVVAAQGEQVSYVVQELSAIQKLLLPLYSPTFYLVNFVWPSSLVPRYLAPELFTTILYAAISLGLLALSLFLARSGKWGLLLALFFFITFLLPTILGQAAGIQPWADRYTYLPSVGLAVLLGWCVLWLFLRTRKAYILVGGMALLLAWVAVSLNQIPRWANSITLWKYAVAAGSEPSILTMVPLGVAYYHEGKIDSALVWYAQALRVRPDSRHAMFNVGVAHEKLGNTDKAILAYESVVGNDSGYYPAQNNLANLYVEQKEFEKAIPLYESMIRRGFVNADAYYNLAVALESQGRVEEAGKMYEAAMKIVPGHGPTHVNLGARAMKAGRVAESIELYRRGLSFDKTNATLHYNLGVAQETLGDTSSALLSYTQAIQQKSDYLNAYVNLGNLYMHSGLPENAYVVFGRALQSGLDSAVIYFGYGVSSEALGNGAEALEAYKKALELDSANVSAFINLGNLYARMGMLDESERVYESALVAGVDSSEVMGNLAIIRAARKERAK